MDRSLDTRWHTAGFGLALLGYTVLVLLLFHALVGRFSTAVPHDLGDPLLSIWTLWWNAHRLPFVGEWWDGLSFYPVHGSLAFSDHRVGLDLIAGPIQWMGGTPILAYNVILLSSFVFCALAAHALTWTLTRSHAAGAVSGVIFGFNPFRLSHIAHLELLVVYWLPLAFIALHLYIRRYKRRYVVLFAALWALQGLSSGYYLFYSAPVIALWAFWFARDRPFRGVGTVLLACGVALVPLMPVLLKYRAIHSQLLLTRGLGEMEHFSADITGMLSATSMMALWRVPVAALNGEGQIYIGIFALLVVLAAALGRRRPLPIPVPKWLRVLRGGVALLATVYALIALGTVFGSWSLKLGPVAVSVSRSDRPLSVVVFSLLVLAITSPTFVGIVRRRSAFAFYTIAAAMTWIFSLGPAPRLFGHAFLYRGPYALLMFLPGFDHRLRVPARFTMMTILAVATAAGIGFVRLTASASRTVRVIVTVLVLGAVIADSWTFTCPVVSVPANPQLPGTVPQAAAILELPLGEIAWDIAAVYHSIAHGHRVVNGYSGYDPPHYRVLVPGLKARDDSVLTTLTTFSPIAVVINRGDDPDGEWTAFVARHAGAVRLGETPSHRFYLLPSIPHGDPIVGRPLRIRGASSNTGPLDIQAVTGGNPRTAWTTPEPQRGGEEVLLELEDLCQVSGLSLSTGPVVNRFPRWLEVATSIDGKNWSSAWNGGVAGAAMESALEDPGTAQSRIGFALRPARFVRLRQLRASREDSWTIADVAVYGTS